MRNFLRLLIVSGLVAVAGCSKETGTSELMDSSEDKLASTISASTGLPGSPGSGGQSRAGAVTAGEWNDLVNWTFWKNILDSPQYAKMPGYWSFFTTTRIPVVVFDQNSKPVADAVVQLKKGTTTVFAAKTDNEGRAELWPGLFGANTGSPLSDYKIDVNNGAGTVAPIKTYEQGNNTVTLTAGAAPQKIDIAFVVDATGSMGDELEFLKTELYDVIDRAEKDNPASVISTASVFYRDEGDDYLTRVSPFSTSKDITIGFIKNQSASGGGDFPEAVHSALDKAVNGLQWSNTAKERLLFLILDAPPHYTPAVISNLQSSIQKAAEKGIKIIPVTASGIDKETEFLMRFFATATNGTYVFITNHSGIGNDHLQATTGPYQVEYLNNLMVRLIDKYAK